jgi:hypothetical protein
MPDELKLPPGATIEDDHGIKLPPGATLESGSYQGPMTSTGIAAPQSTDSFSAKDFGTGIAQGAAQTTGGLVSTASRLLHKIPYIGERLAPETGIRSLEAITEERSKPQNTTQQIGKTGEQIAEWMIPSGAEEKAATLIGRIPRIGRAAAPIAKLGTTAIESGFRNKVQGGDFATGAEVGVGAGLLGEAGRVIAPKLAERAIRVPSRDIGHGRTIGQAVLDETSSIRPSAIARQAGAKARVLTRELEAGTHAATGAGAHGTTDAAHQILDDALANAPRNAPSYKEKLESLRGLLDFHSGIGPQQRVFTPDDVLEMKRGIDKEISSWDHASRQSVDPLKRKLYRALDSELDRTVPGAEGLNQRISSLIPAQNAASKTAAKPGLIARIGAPTALGLGRAGVGAALGYREGRTTESALVGGIGGLIVPELLRTPGVQMGAARVAASPSTYRALRGIPLQLTRSDLRRDREKR